MSHWISWWVVANYVVIMLACAYERRWPMVLYWFGAVLIVISTIWINRRN